MHKIILITICFCLFACKAEQVDSACKNTAKLLETIKNNDQDDRKHFFENSYNASYANDLTKNDKQRREKVAVIFADGCFKSAQDYTNAALVFQHGTQPDHFYQAYLWAKKAVALGDVKQSILMVDAIDRYLISMGYKQFFGTQAQMQQTKNSSACFCLQSVEKNFPDSYRIKYLGRSIQDQYAWIKELNKGKSCPNQECKILLKPIDDEVLTDFAFIKNNS